MEPIKILGVDPGLHGGFAFLSTRLNVGPLPLLGLRRNNKERSRLDVRTFHALIEYEQPDFVVIENVHGFKGQGGGSGFTFGDTFGRIDAAAIILEKPVYYVPPIVWQARIGVRREKVQGGADDKEAARRVALKLFPDVMAAWQDSSHDGIWEAALIAEYARRFQPWATA